MALISSITVVFHLVIHTLILIGALSVGITGAFGINILQLLFGRLESAVQIAIGLAALFLIGHRLFTV